MLDAHLQTRLAQNYADAAAGYANASVAAFTAMADRSMAFWMPAASAPQPAGRRDHLSWFNGGRSPVDAASTTDLFNPWTALNMWTEAVTAAMQPKASQPSMMAMAMSFSPFAVWWGQAMRAPHFAWPMAYQMMATGVPANVAWPAAEANAAVLDAANVVKQQVEQVFSVYQSSGGFATAHIWPPKPAALAISAFLPFAAMWSMTGGSLPGAA